jgi:hypothetical protein
VIETAVTRVSGEVDLALQCEAHRSGAAHLVLGLGVHGVVDRQLQFELTLIVQLEQRETIGDRQQTA